jgi:selT/selW/selH-like putative selenoprotein
VKPRLVKGDGGVFDVEVDGRLVFSKHQQERFPEPGEITALLRG